MGIEFDFVTADDKPALLGVSKIELVETVQMTLDKMSYKVHTAANHGELLHRFAQIAYQLVILEECFACTGLDTHESLSALRKMTMNNRRHAVFVLIGESMATFNPLQAFQLGVHAVIHPNEIFLLNQLVEKAVADNDLFLNTFRNAQLQLT